LHLSQTSGTAIGYIIFKSCLDLEKFSFLDECTASRKTVLINNFQGFTAKEGGLCKYNPEGQDLRADLIIIFINDKLDGTLAKSVDVIKWSVVLCTSEEKNSH